MVLAVGATLFALRPPNFLEILLVLSAGGLVGLFFALRIRMTALPQLVAAFHSLVGLAAVLGAGAAFLNPEGFGLALTESGQLFFLTRLEMSLGAAVGALTFSGSVVAFGKLQGLLPGRPLLLPGLIPGVPHGFNVLLGLGVVVSALVFYQAEGFLAALAFWSLIGLAFLLGGTLILAVGGADMRSLCLC